MKFGICGYGNLGKAIEREIHLRQKDDLIAIFSRRKDIKSDYNTPIIDYHSASKYIDQIDTMIMCGGSQKDLEWQSPDMLKYFNIIDTFDTHARILEHGKKLDEIGKKYGHTAIYSCGWDPGLFSLIRAILSDVFDANPYTFWGKGVSQGHSEALRNIPGIRDAIQFTVPNKEIKERIYNEKRYIADSNKMHERHCYICLDGTRPLKDIKEEILNTENYFKGQKVFVNEVSFEEIQELKQKMYHEGEIICRKNDLLGDFHLKMDDNPSLTAKILLAYTSAIKKLPSGSFSILDIPVNFITSDNHRFL